MKFKLKILDDRITPDYLKPKNPDDAGIDLCAVAEDGETDQYVINELGIDLLPGEVKLIRTGIAVYIEDRDYAGIILPRSGLGHKKGLILGNTAGLIDAPYQGELKISAWNRSDEAIFIKPMDRIAQIIFVPVIHPEFEIVDSFDESARGNGGFGSTGV